MDLRPNILLSYFEPFGGAETNISQQVAEGITADGVIQLCLPVSFRRAPKVLREAIERYQPQFILSLGQCAEGENVRIERFAINMMDSTKADNDGYIPNEEVIDNEAPIALKTDISIKRLNELCHSADLPTIVSNSAGLYVCNRVYFEALRYTDKALFVHIPKNMNKSVAQQIICNIYGLF